MSRQTQRGEGRTSTLWVVIGIIFVVWQLYKGFFIQEIGFGPFTFKFGKGEHPDSTTPVAPMPTNPAPRSTSCDIAGHVFNSDNSPNTPLSGARIFVRDGVRPDDWKPLASSAPDGSFGGSCLQFASDAFPLHLGVTRDDWRCSPADPPFSEQGWETVQPGGAADVNLLVSVKYMARLKLIACRH